MSANPDNLLTLTQAARLLGLAPATLRAQTERGAGPIPTKIKYERGRPSADGMQYAYSLAEIERYVRDKADPETAMSYWLGRLWLAFRALEPDEVAAQLEALRDLLPGVAAFPRVADVWANVGMALLADATARGIEIPDLKPASKPATRLHLTLSA